MGRRIIFIAAALHGVISLPLQAHSGHSHSASTSLSSKTGNPLSLESSVMPLAFGLGLRGGYENDPYTAFMPGVAFCWNGLNFLISPGYQFQFRQFVTNKTESRSQDLNHRAWIVLERKLAGEIFSFQIQNEFGSTNTRSAQSNFENVLQFTASPELVYTSLITSLKLGYQFQHRYYPEGSQILPLLPLSDRSILPRQWTASPSDPEVRKGLNDQEHHLGLSASWDMDRFTLGGDVRGIRNFSQMSERNFWGSRVEGLAHIKLWKNAMAQLNHQFEWRAHSEETQYLNKTELGIFHVLTSYIAIAWNSNLNLMNRTENNRWMETYVEIRTLF